MPPAFAATAAPWTAAATRDALARRPAPRLSTPPKTTVVLRPGQRKSPRVFQPRPTNPARPRPRPRSRPRPASPPPSADPDPDLGLGLDLDLDPVSAETPAVQSPPSSPDLASVPLDHLSAADLPSAQNDKTRKQKQFLHDQLEQRQSANLQKKQKRKRAAKRVRSATPKTVSMHNAAIMKDTFQAYMDEISREHLLGQAEVASLATEIKLGVAVEEAQRKMEAKLGRRPSIPELANNLHILPQEVQKRRMAGTAAKNALVAANLRLVTSVARKVASTKGASTAGIALDDMVQEGSVGLIRAAEKFDASRGYRFSTYATWWIRAYVMRSITTQSRSIKVPSTIVDEYARIRKQYAALQESGIFKPTDEQVAHELGITAAKLRFVIKVVTQVPTSLDLSLNPGGNSNNPRALGEIVEGDDNVEERMVQGLQRKELDIALQRCLRPLERAVIRLRFGLDDGQPRTLRETGELLGLSKERIRQLLFRALPKMKTPEIEQMLIDATAR